MSAPRVSDELLAGHIVHCQRLMDVDPNNGERAARLYLMLDLRDCRARCAELEAECAAVRSFTTTQEAAYQATYEALRAAVARARAEAHAAGWREGAAAQRASDTNTVNRSNWAGSGALDFILVSPPEQRQHDSGA